MAATTKTTEVTAPATEVRTAPVTDSHSANNNLSSTDARTVTAPRLTTATPVEVIDVEKAEKPKHRQHSKHSALLLAAAILGLILGLILLALLLVFVVRQAHIQDRRNVGHVFLHDVDFIRSGVATITTTVDIVATTTATGPVTTITV